MRCGIGNFIKSACFAQGHTFGQGGRRCFNLRRLDPVQDFRQVNRRPKAPGLALGAFDVLQPAAASCCAAPRSRPEAGKMPPRSLPHSLHVGKPVGPSARSPLSLPPQFSLDRAWVAETVHDKQLLDTVGEPQLNRQVAKFGQRPLTPRHGPYRWHCWLPPVRQGRAS